MNLSFVTKAAKREFLKLPEDIKIDFANSFNQILRGEKPLLQQTHLSSVGNGAIELKINGSPAYRVIYVTKYNDILYILCSFIKTTNGVDTRAIKRGKKRYKEIPI